MDYRAKELELILQSRELSEARKEQKKSNMRKSEANFLRFLRTSERPQNYNTLKIIGKGAFGEVKLVQRKHDGKIYALKSLIKAEMVCSTLIRGMMFIIAGVLYQNRYIDSCDSIRRINWHTSAPSATFSRTRIVRGW